MKSFDYYYFVFVEGILFVSLFPVGYLWCLQFTSEPFCCRSQLIVGILYASFKVFLYVNGQMQISEALREL